MQFRQYELFLLGERSRTHPRPGPPSPRVRPGRRRRSWRRPVRGRLRREPDPRLDVQQYLALEFAVDDRR